jgi:hypothetical protein
MPHIVLRLLTHAGSRITASSMYTFSVSTKKGALLIPRKGCRIQKYIGPTHNGQWTLALISSHLHQECDHRVNQIM